MKRSRTLIKTLLVVDPMAAALSALAPNSSYAYAAVDPVSSPYCPNLSCDGGWDGGWHRGFDHRGFAHSGFGHGGLGGHGGFGGGGGHGGGGGGHGR